MTNADTVLTWMLKRALTQIEQKVLDFIEANPGQTSEEIATYFCGLDGNRAQVHIAVEYLIAEGYADRNLMTGSINTI